MAAQCRRRRDTDRKGKIRYEVRNESQGRPERQLTSREVLWVEIRVLRFQQLGLSPADGAHSRRPIRNESSEKSSKTRRSHFGRLLSLLLSTLSSLFAHLLSPTLFSSASLSSSPVSPPSIAAPIFFPPYVSSVFSATISPCQQCQPGPCAAEKIEPQIEQSISVRIHQCQTTPSLAVCIEHAHTHSYF